MKFFQEWTFCVCASLVAAVLFSMFTPRGSMNRFYKMLLALFVFLSFLYPFRDFRAADFRLDTYQSELLQQEEGTAAYREGLERQIRQTLKENGIDGAAVTCRLTLDYATRALEIQSVEVAVSDEVDKKEVEALLFDTLGIKARVIGIGE